MYNIIPVVHQVPYQIPQSRPSFPPGSAWQWRGRNPRQRTTPCEPRPCPVGSPCPGERVEPCSCSSLPPLLSLLSLQLVGKRCVGYITYIYVLHTFNFASILLFPCREIVPVSEVPLSLKSYFPFPPTLCNSAVIILAPMRKILS